MLQLHRLRQKKEKREGGRNRRQARQAGNIYTNKQVSAREGGNKGKRQTDSNKSQKSRNEAQEKYTSKERKIEMQVSDSCVMCWVMHAKKERCECDMCGVVLQERVWYAG